MAKFFRIFCGAQISLCTDKSSVTLLNHCWVLTFISVGSEDVLDVRIIDRTKNQNLCLLSLALKSNTTVHIATKAFKVV